ncbi:MAG: transcription termination factor Rho, partial [Clostridia bacterium]|nr:transcription termination factor Rho [Clostridia bacterium]
GTGNMEVHLDRKLQEKRIFPAVDISKSGTRKEELLMDKDELEAVWKIRRKNMTNAELTEKLIGILVKTDSNKELINLIDRW